ncbi:MAG: preprotein translocase subunit SecE [Bacilli bacterium]
MAAQANQGVKTKNKFSLVSYIKETKQELKRVSWPTKQELLKNTGVVLTVVISSTILVWALDSVLSGALGLILNR